MLQLKEDENNKSIGLKFIYPSNKTEISKKIFPIKLSRKELEVYTGSYYSHELDTHYHIVRKDDELVAKHPWHQDTKLISYDEDLFISRAKRYGNHLSGEIDWVRNQGHEIMGFKLNGGRVSKIWFYKRS